MNISYDQTKQQRSAAGTARTTPGIGGTTGAPSQFQGQNQYGTNPAYGATPSTPPATYTTLPVNSTPNLSKAAGGKGAGTPNKPAWLTESQNRFQSRVNHTRKKEGQQAEQMGQKQQYKGGQMMQGLREQMRMAAEDPNYTPSSIPQDYQYQAAGPQQVPSMQPQDQIPQLQQMNMDMRNPQYQQMFQRWLQQQYGQGLLGQDNGQQQQVDATGTV